MGTRGEAWVAVQAILFLLIVFAPAVGMPWPFPAFFAWAGWLGVAAGVVFLAWSARNLGRSLTPFPKPLPEGQLVTTGAYRFVRHPIYFGVLVTCLGFSMATMSPLRVALTIILFVFFDRKARREERWLEEKYPDYAAYRQRVKRLIPGIY